MNRRKILAIAETLPVLLRFQNVEILSTIFICYVSRQMNDTVIKLYFYFVPLVHLSSLCRRKERYRVNGFKMISILNKLEVWSSNVTCKNEKNAVVVLNVRNYVKIRQISFFILKYSNNANFTFQKFTLGPLDSTWNLNECVKCTSKLLLWLQFPTIAGSKQRIFSLIFVIFNEYFVTPLFPFLLRNVQILMSSTSMSSPWNISLNYHSIFYQCLNLHLGASLNFSFNYLFIFLFSIFLNFRRNVFERTFF